MARPAQACCVNREDESRREGVHPRTGAPRAGPGVGPEGLCPSCAYARTVRSARGSIFLLCELSRSDPRFPRYPPQPRILCAGFRPRD